MKYILYDKDRLKWKMIYCNNHTNVPETDEEIARAIVSRQYIDRFDINENLCVNNMEIENNEKLFLLMNNCVTEIWQIGDAVTDMEEFVIPNTYYVRKVGIVVYEYI